MSLTRRRLAVAAAALAALAAPGLAQTTPREPPMVLLFKVITPRDEIVVGFKPAELEALGAVDAGGLAKALAAQGALTAWQYAVRKAASGDMEQAPRQKVGLMANAALRIEPYATPLKIVPHE